MIFQLHAGFEPTLSRWLSAGLKGSASAVKRTRAVYVTGEHSTTEPPLQTIPKVFLIQFCYSVMWVSEEIQLLCAKGGAKDHDK